MLEGSGAETDEMRGDRLVSVVMAAPLRWKAGWLLWCELFPLCFLSQNASVLESPFQCSDGDAAAVIRAVSRVAACVLRDYSLRALLIGWRLKLTL